MTVIKTVWDFLRDMLGFRKNTKYVRTYLNDVNVKSSIYMSFIIIVIEIWMIFRQIFKYIAPNWDSYEGFSGKFNLIFTYTSLYYLFIMCSVAMFMFSLFYVNKINTRKSFITNIVLGSLCVLWIFLLIPENISGTTINKITTILVYVSMPIFGLTLIGDSLYLKFKGKNNYVLSVILITCFAMVCLLFGVKVGYSDFANPYINAKTGLPNYDRLKMITCFLTMVIFAACLLIWKPYISITLLLTSFILFYSFLESYDGREFLEGDKINYITFLISLTMVTISIYQQRITEAKKDERLIHDAVYDHLINIHNVNYFSSEIIRLQKTNPYKIQNGIYLFTNIANFRIINSQKGFDEGDKVLREIGLRFEKAFPNDLVARQSDDHFIIFTEKNNLENKIKTLDEIVKKASDGLYVLLKVGGYVPMEGENPNKSIDKARYACNMIKRMPETNYLEYDEKINDIFIKRQYIVNHLDEAIEKGWIRAFYQPVVWSNDHKLCGIEALARWIDPIIGFLSPADFIPVLEENRLIHKLDRCIIDCVFKNMRNAIDKGRTIVPVSINFSRLDFELMDVESTLDELVNKYEIDKKYVHVEITESALINSENFLNTNIKKIKNLGYSVWLDDFGSGYSSLNVLKDFTFDVVKIDMKFLTNFDSNEKTKDILDCIIQLANRLGMNTLTEGVETEAESKFLEKIGCERLQGYLFGKPYSLEDLENKIDNKELIISNKLL
ncbi:MAG: EAL domain-containing protein [Acholeplasmatales bacterium]|nr:EAL domain-containing protein [Acholeplasmatales bacterium]